MITSTLNKQEAITDLNSMILKMTMVISEYYPELAGFLEEMPDTISDNADLEVTIEQLESYFESLSSLLTKYLLEHPISSR
ncbi:hypothetical protein ACRTDU_09385 [Sunxiuqinia elliptica]|uniref:Uncharacterized protein n=1 Tax=Sunxiuqinia elliptica TaxID=655355 RepID=A0A1I2FYB0_9BACT|nr:hypothetical protein [Sunxiuqinia elliptica]SFF09690.1 hypothetical protein SAMN05216283_102652 [Sunxiuqinia elliptica]